MISLSVLWGYVQLLQTTAESIAEHRAACLVYRTTPALTEAGQRWGGVIAKKDDTEKSKWKRFEKECVIDLLCG